MFDKLGKWIDNAIMVIARHGKTECHDCGTFKPKGIACMCRRIK